ncbi:MAG: hypothetical protein AAF730_14935 [Bacteroidota bacterium]
MHGRRSYLVSLLAIVGVLCMLPAEATARAPLTHANPADSTEAALGRVVLGAGGGFGRNTFSGNYRLSYQTATYALTVHATAHGGVVESGSWVEYAVLYGAVLPTQNATVTVSAGLAYLEGSNNADLLGLLDQLANGTEDAERYAGFSLPVSLAVSEPLLGPIGFGGYVFANVNPRHMLIGATVEISLQLDL